MLGIFKPGRIVSYAFLTVVFTCIFGVATSLPPQKISQKDPLYGYGSDSEVYWDLAGNLAHGRGFVHSPGFDFSYLHKTSEFTQGTQRLPGYPLALSLIRALDLNAAPNSWLAWMFNLSLVFLNSYFVIGILVILYPNTKTVFFWLVALFPPFLIYANGINSDFFAATLISAAVYFSLASSRWRYLSVCFGAFAVFTRGNVLFFLVPFWLMLAIYYRRQRRDIKPAVFGLAAIALIFIGWSFRNQALSDRFVFAPFTGLQLRQNYIYKIYEDQRPAGEERYWRWRAPEYLKQRFEDLNSQTGSLYKAESQLDKELVGDTIQLVLERPAAVVFTYGRDIVQMLTNEYFLFNLGRSVNSPWLWGGIWPVAIIFYLLPGAWLLLLAARFFIRKFFAPLSIIVFSAAVYIFLTAAVLGDFARYLLPVGFAIIIAVKSAFQKYD